MRLKAGLPSSCWTFIPPIHTGTGSAKGLLNISWSPCTPLFGSRYVCLSHARSLYIIDVSSGHRVTHPLKSRHLDVSLIQWVAGGETLLVALSADSPVADKVGHQKHALRLIRAADGKILWNQFRAQQVTSTPPHALPRLKC